MMRLVLVEGLGLAGIGLAIGLAGAFGVTRLLESLLFGITARDPLTFGVVGAILASVRYWPVISRRDAPLLSTRWWPFATNETLRERFIEARGVPMSGLVFPELSGTTRASSAETAWSRLTVPSGTISGRPCWSNPTGEKPRTATSPPRPGLVFHVGANGYYAFLLGGAGPRNGAYDVEFELVRKTFSHAAATVLIP